MEGTLGCIAQHMVGSIANGTVSSELQDAWKEFLHPDYACISVVLPSNLVVAIEDVTSADLLTACMQPAAGHLAEETLRKLAQIDRASGRDVQPHQMSISLKVLTRTLSKMFKPLSTPLVQELSTGLYCGRAVRVPVSASLPAGPRLLHEQLCASANVFVKPEQLPVHMGYKRKLIRSARALAAVHARASEALAPQELPPPCSNGASAVTQSCAAVQRACSSVADVAAEPAREGRILSDGADVLPTASSGGEVRAEKVACNTAGKGAPVTVEATIMDQPSKPSSSSKGLGSSKSPLHGQFKQNARSLRFTDANVEEQYRVFSNVQQLQIDLSALAVTLLLATLCSLFSASAPSTALPFAAPSPWVPRYVFLQIVHSAGMLLALCSFTDWYVQWRDSLLLSKHIFLLLMPTFLTASAALNGHGDWARLMVIGLQCCTIEAWAYKVVFHKVAPIRTVSLILVACASAMGSAPGSAAPLFQLGAFAVLGYALPLYVSRKGEILERSIFSQLLAHGSKQLAQDLYAKGRATSQRLRGLSMAF